MRGWVDRVSIAQASKHLPVCGGDALEGGAAAGSTGGGSAAAPFLALPPAEAGGGAVGAGVNKRRSERVLEGVSRRGILEGAS